MALTQTHHDSTRRRRVAIAGFDVEGQASWRYLSRQGQADITILDEQQVQLPGGATGKLGPGVFDEALDYDEVWRTPGLPPSRIKTSGEITSGTIEFLKQCPARVIGVTGTKGKGTTATLTQRILEAGGQTTHLVGNIGTPALDKLPHIKSEDIVVYELSSFQLWDVKQSPIAAVILMIEPEHLDKHPDLDDYINAKSNIARWQDDGGVVIYHPTNKLSARAAAPGLGKKLKYLTQNSAFIEENHLFIAGQEICSVSDFALPGPHNHENIAAAATAAWQFSQDAVATAKAIKAFTGLPHRLERIAQKKGVTYVDDSFATTPATALAAARSFDQPKIMIIGGSDKGSDYAVLAKGLAGLNVKKVLLIGQMAEAIRGELDKVGGVDYEPVEGDMTRIVARAAELAEAGDAVLLSPACASFDMFKDYLDRAEQFKAAVEKL